MCWDSAPLPPPAPPSTPAQSSSVRLSASLPRSDVNRHTMSDSGGENSVLDERVNDGQAKLTDALEAIVIEDAGSYASGHSLTSASTHLCKRCQSIALGNSGQYAGGIGKTPRGPTKNLGHLFQEATRGGYMDQL